MLRINHTTLAKLLAEARAVARMDIVKMQDLKRAPKSLLVHEGWLTEVVRGY